MSRPATGIHLRTKAGSPYVYVRATLPGGKRWEASTGVPRAGDRAEASRRAAGLFAGALAKHRSSAAFPPGIAQQVEIVDLVAQYLEHEETSYTGHDGRHVGRVGTDLRKYVLTRWTHVDQITEGAWLTARDELHKSRGGPLGARSIAHLANTLRHFLDWALEHRFVAAVPRIKSPPSKQQKAEKKKRTALDADQRDRFLRALHEMGELRAERIYTALFYSLLRQGELAALAEAWLDRRRREIHVPPEHSKSGQLEIIDLHPEVARAIREEIAAQKAALPEKERELRRDPDEPVFGRFDFHQANTPKLRGGLFGKACLRAKLARLGKDGRVEFRGLTPHHVTRHSSATIAAGRRGTTLEELMALGRWKDAQIPSQYLHPSVKAGRRASRRL